RVLLDVRLIAEMYGNAVAEAAADALARRRPDLFPGEAGRIVAWSIVCGDKFRPEYRQPDGQIRRPFEDPFPPFTASFTMGGRNRYAPRAARLPYRKQKLLKGLAGRKTYPELARSLGMSGRQLNSEISRLRQRQGIMIRPSHEQRVVTEIVRSAIALA